MHPVTSKPEGEVYGRWQGAHWSRLCRSAILVLLAVLLIVSWQQGISSVSQGLATLAFCIGTFTLGEWLFVRRMGLEIQAERLILRGPVRRLAIPWSEIEGLRWRDARSMSRTKYLYVLTKARKPKRFPPDAPVRLPTISCPSDSYLLNERWLGKALASPKLRGVHGEEVDAVSLLETALSKALRTYRR